MRPAGQQQAGPAPGRIQEKICRLDELGEILQERRSETIAHCHGVFDLLHPGHIRHLHEAREMGDILVVTVTPDRFVDKGPGRPVFSEELRVETLASLDCVDYVAINTGPKALPAIETIEPDLYVKGPDYADPDDDITGGIVEEREAVEAAGGQLATTSDITFSSSNLINNYLPVLSEEAREYLQRFQTEYHVDDVLSYLEGAQEMSVLVVGETILDEYQYVESLGKATKDPVLVTRYKDTGLYAGGILAIANHLAAFVAEVQVLTMIGVDKEQEAFIHEQLRDNVEPIFVRTQDAPTILKRRFVDDYLTQKLFEVYEIDQDAIRDEERQELHEAIQERATANDAVLVADYGHGMIDDTAVALLETESPFLAVNTQSNAGNRGFNTISKYPSADWFCLAEHEVALEERDRDGHRRTQLEAISERLGCERSMMTRGKAGTLAWSKDTGFHEAPALAHRVVDRIGAGDAVFSLTTLAAVQEAPMDILGFLGNVAGAEAVQIVGNEESLERLSLMKHVETLMK